MRVKVISDFQSARGIVPAGSIINIQDHLLEKLKGKVEALSVPAAPPVPTTCQARKANGKICGAEFKIGVNGFKSCSEPGCQVPALRPALVRRGGKA